MSIYCTTTLNYSNELGYQPTTIDIHDGRVALSELTYEECGFTLLPHHSNVENWYDETHVQVVHGPEIETLARAYLGCDHALVYPPLIRSPQTAIREGDYAPIEFVHSDFSEDYRGMVCEADRPYRTFLDPLLAAAGLSRQDVVEAKRIVMLQFWRNIGAVRPDRPFALCDASTTPRSQLYGFRVSEYGGLTLEFETLCAKPPADMHRWYTFPDLSIDEVIAFRTYDSRCADENRPFWTMHSAFQDPTVGTDAPRRESVEMRALCLFS